jgi:hypothetical protein
MISASVIGTGGLLGVGSDRLVLVTDEQKFNAQQPTTNNNNQQQPSNSGIMEQRPPDFRSPERP